MRGAILPIPQHAFMAWCSVKKHRNNFTFTFTHNDPTPPSACIAKVRGSDLRGCRNAGGSKIEVSYIIWNVHCQDCRYETGNYELESWLFKVSSWLSNMAHHLTRNNYQKPARIYMLKWYLDIITFHIICLRFSCYTVSSGHLRFFAGVKRPRYKADYSPPYKAEVKNVWSYTATALHVFMA
jgi:hypothetical protein